MSSTGTSATTMVHAAQTDGKLSLVIQLRTKLLVFLFVDLQKSMNTLTS